MLGKAEQFYLTLSPIYRIKERMFCFYFKQKFTIKILEIQRDIGVLNKVVKEFRQSKKLISIMEVISNSCNYLKI